MNWSVIRNRECNRTRVDLELIHRYRNIYFSKNKPSCRDELLHNIYPVNKPTGNRLYDGTFDNRYAAAIRVGHMKLLTGDVGKLDQFSPEGYCSNPSHRIRNKDKNIWLFNITADPTEDHDLSDSHPDIVKKLLDRLAFYNSTAVPWKTPEYDPNANPELHGGAWVPWMQ